MGWVLIRDDIDLTLGVEAIEPSRVDETILLATEHPIVSSKRGEEGIRRIRTGYHFNL